METERCLNCKHDRRSHLKGGCEQGWVDITVGSNFNGCSCPSFVAPVAQVTATISATTVACVCGEVVVAGIPHDCPKNHVTPRPTSATPFEEMSCREAADRYKDWPAHLKRLIAAILLRAADEAKR